MNFKRGWFHFRLIVGPVCLMLTINTPAWTPTEVHDDPLVRMPGTQPEQFTGLDSDKNCLSCHGGFEMDNWKGSMMAQASRDPLFWAAMTVTAQDSIWAVGNPNAADLCMRCHFPMGWLDGRSEQPNGSLMQGEDYDGVSCKICHYMFNPHFKGIHDGTREGSDWVNHWDESGTVPQDAADDTYAADAAAAALIKRFDDEDFFVGNVPFSPLYTENGGGQYFIFTDNYATGDTDVKRASFADANAKHEMLYSRYHKSRDMCGTCHDVSNPVLHNLFNGTGGTNGLPSEIDPAFSYFHIERTFSEFMLSGYSVNGGLEGTGPYSPDRFKTSHTGNKIANCQDCHFRDLPDGNKAGNSGVVRWADSAAHPMSGVPQHRMTGGNAWIPWILASLVESSPNHDPTNVVLLVGRESELTLDFTQGEALDPFLLLDTVTNAHRMLQESTSMTNAGYSLATSTFMLRLQNHTPHKVISGFPEGRRMFLNVKAFVGDELIYEINPYDSEVGTLKGLDPAHSPHSPALEDWEEYVDELVYEVHPSSTNITGEAETFHMALSTGRYKDNRIPPRGFDIANAADRLCEPVWHGKPDTNYFTATEYALGCDDIEVGLPDGTERIEAGLYYQTTSREFIEFLRDEINGVGGTLTGTGAGGDPPYIAQTNDWFSGLAAWGDTIWQLWEHNKDVPGAAPVLVTNTLVQLDVTDDDGDGIPAYWELFYFGGNTNAVASVDSDGDGPDNYSEYIAFTIPTDSNSVFRIAGEFNPTGGVTEVIARFESRRSRDYVLEETTNLLSNSWSSVSENMRGNDSEMGLTTTNSIEAGMYRVKATIPGTP